MKTIMIDFKKYNSNGVKSIEGFLGNELIYDTNFWSWGEIDCVVWSEVNPSKQGAIAVFKSKKIK